MFKKKILKIFFLLFVLLFLIFQIYSKFYKDPEEYKPSQEKNVIINEQENLISSNVIKDVNYVTRDADGNEYTVTSSEGEIDLNNENILFLTNVKASIKLKNASFPALSRDPFKQLNEEHHRSPGGLSPRPRNTGR